MFRKTLLLLPLLFSLGLGADDFAQLKKLVASDRGAGDNFGKRVAISGDYAIVGAIYEDEDADGANTLLSTGSAYIFKKDQDGKPGR